MVKYFYWERTIILNWQIAVNWDEIFYRTHYIDPTLDANRIKTDLKPYLTREKGKQLLEKATLG